MTHRVGPFVSLGFLVLVVAAGIGLSGCKKSGGSGGKDGGGDSRDGAMCSNTDGGPPTKDVGQSCGCDNECRSGFCVDGYCCSTACTDKCMSCGLATSLGTCTPTPSGLPPRDPSQCPMQAADTCGLDGMCDGNKGCRQYQAGVQCKAGTCNAASVEGRFICDGKGMCKLGGTMICSPFTCDPATSTCRQSCANDGECSPGQRCENGSCGKRPNGYQCKGDTECASGHCADGFCCNTACDGPCQVCNLVALEGTCSPTPTGHPHPKCQKQNQSTCGTAGVCDGFGVCTMYPVGTVCQGASCSGNALNTVRTCDGLGTCRSSEVRQCSPFRCVDSAGAGACTERCDSNDQCAPDRACDLATHSCGKKPDGATCAAAGDCQSGFCVDGLCCNEACNGTCRSCALSGSAGRCTPVPNGMTDPKTPNECTDQGPQSCGTDGKCDGAGACRKYAVGTVCAGKSCTEDVATAEWACNASGQCVKPRSISCYPYHCNGDQCFDSCSTNAQCITPNVCGQTMAGSCGAKGNGQPCAAASECASNFCAQGVCCNAACTGACQSCNLAATKGICSPVQSGPDARCPVTAASTCGTTGQCAGGRCAVYATGTKCKDASCSGSTLTPASTCNGSGMCVTPANVACAPGRCENASCVNSCDASKPNQCTAPATCVGSSCGLVPRGGSCTVTSACQAGLTCVEGVCCDRACNGICETCRKNGAMAGICTLRGAGDDDPSDMCPTNTTMMCGYNGRCNGSGNVASTPNTVAARCQTYGSDTGCRVQSCTPGSGSTAAVQTLAASCNATTAMCPAAQTVTCTGYVKCDGTQCPSSCTSDADCVSGVKCNTQSKKCGDKLGNGAICSLGSDCTSGNCVEGVCCNVAAGSCQGPCKSCNNAQGECMNTTAACGTASCSGNQFTPAGVCSGGNCMQTPMTCANNLTCDPATMSCRGTCSSDDHCVGGLVCSSGSCKKPDGQMCSNHAECGSGACIDGVCCNSSCTGACKACNLPGKVGMCSDVASGADPLCAPTSTCGMTGQCSNGSCAVAGSSTPCGATGCKSSTEKWNAGMCDGAGNCSQTSTACDANACQGCSSGTCSSTCTGGQICDGAGMCVDPPM